MKENIIVEKSYVFAVHALKSVKSLDRSIENYVLIKQLIRSATSIGANVEEEHRGDRLKRIFIINLIFRTKKQRKLNIG